MASEDLSARREFANRQKRLKSEIIREVTFDGVIDGARSIDILPDARILVRGYAPKDGAPLAAVWSPKADKLETVAPYRSAIAENASSENLSRSFFPWGGGFGCLDYDRVHVISADFGRCLQTYPIRNMDFLAGMEISRQDSFGRTPKPLSAMAVSDDLLLVTLSDSFRVRVGRFFAFLRRTGDCFAWVGAPVELNSPDVMAAWRDRAMGSSWLFIVDAFLGEGKLRTVTNGGQATHFNSGPAYETKLVIDYDIVGAQDNKGNARNERGFWQRFRKPLAPALSLKAVTEVPLGDLTCSRNMSYSVLKLYGLNKTLIYPPDLSAPRGMLPLTPGMNLGPRKHDRVALAFDDETMLVGDKTGFNVCQILWED
ncbi:hypothetical protein [Thalassospira lucentensis]|uniref:hypothetical protein n=1 Tax=Thalassospira lucentensis TaxID=168935 RepID=UPI003AA893C9